jgi:hypothetical protein
MIKIAVAGPTRASAGSIGKTALIKRLVDQVQG